MTVDRIRHPQRLGDRLGEPDVADVSFVAFFEGWPSDLLRLHSSIVDHVGGAWEMVVVDNPVDDDASEQLSSLEGVVHVPLRDPVGWAAARNLGLRLASGRIAVVVDTSVELTGDVAEGLEAMLADPSVGAAGPWGLVTSDGFEFTEAGGEVHAIESYLMAVRRSDLQRTGLFDPKFRFYRNADIDMSFRVRSAGPRAVADPGLPAVRHEHRTWESLAPDERDELSRANFSRFRRRWADHPDLFGPVAPGP